MDPYLVLLQVGFAVPVRYRTRGALLPHHFTLTGPSPPLAASERTWRCDASPARSSGGKGVTRDVGGIFLLHFPSACAAQALPGTLPYGARTFLGTLASDATVWPTPPGRILRYRCRAERRGDFKLAIAL
ncbi:hypothetical protein XFF6166_490130 [Xanthomonas citri pv. fuscans]|nr:hypothetical protein XFF6166_490130 [Xanthomonas citri pv. fuscans]SOO00651.1 hypothetical protein XFF7767_1080052 [Xanthomonas citri pv. fuscans]SOO01307.1 hypothetical protein XFF6960_460130 [Xanthomonas citri pv. fuscans]SOO09907.1 hypothetical protein XFF6970_490042 [Xanthomonas citri pv. fuscans]SOO14390.1 hypothetical protein XFF7766_30130 [Xanthomonas citri pv. fuscans]